MTASRQKKRAWEAKFKRLTDAAQKAQEAILVGVHEARQDGLSGSDVAYMIGDRSSSGIKAKEEKGRAILERRKRGNQPS